MSEVLLYLRERNRSQIINRTVSAYGWNLKNIKDLTQNSFKGCWGRRGGGGYMGTSLIRNSAPPRNLQ